MILLFIRIFLICLSALLVTSALTAYWRDKTDEKMLNEDIISDYQQQIESVYKEQGLRGLRHWVRQNNHRAPYILLVDSHSPLAIMGFKPRWEPRDRINTWLDRHWNKEKKLDLTIPEAGNTSFWLMIKPERDMPPPPPRPLWPILLAIITISLFVAFFVTRPIKRLSKDIRSWHDNRFHGSIDTRIARRKDSLGDLGKELNALSANVHTLLEQQKQLLRDVSHELRSPMARIRVASELLKHPESKNQDQLIIRIDDEIETLDQLVEELLTLQRWQSPGQDIQAESFDLHQLCTEIKHRLQIEADQKHVQIRLNADKPVMNFSGIEKPLKRALENILRNGIRFSPEAGEIKLQIKQSQDRSIQLTIEDQGPGVEEEQLEQLFDPFFRADNARTPGGKSIGVGLTIAREGVRLNNGDISASNKYDTEGNRQGLVIHINIKEAPPASR
ncbi:sensor histidine kinase [Oceanospirillum sediminis]|uniref:histidine kinase n=1 Tax=Oceanospirillum sediminis TaxID=2760088 RepID=A0A839IN13_9GAMM|nr:HAMP domain-containing sensor histidine kinase [Oceanospirillum sediminis]MBB1486843.1 HAMP domain-containing histidine kinase [Oceanospirillum sediminis]